MQNELICLMLGCLFVSFNIQSNHQNQLNCDKNSHNTPSYIHEWCDVDVCRMRVPFFSSFVYIINYNIMCLCVYRRTHTPFDTSKKSRRRRCRTVRFSLHVQNLKYRIHKWEKISLELLYLHVCVRPFIFKCL